MPKQITEPARSLRRKLGRGLSSLISTPVHIAVPGAQSQSADHDGYSPDADRDGAIPDHEVNGAGGLGLSWLHLDRILPNPHQPRQSFDEKSLHTLAESIRTSGLMQPIVVRPARDGSHREHDRYEIVAGERRCRAARIAGLLRIPAVIRDVDDQQAAELSLIENLQREDLNPLDRAEAFHHLVSEFSLTHAELADRVGLERSSVSNHLRLLELDAETKDAVRGGAVTPGHARALLAITNIKTRRLLLDRTIRQAWSVRTLEQQVRRFTQPPSASADQPRRQPSLATLNIADLERQLGEHLGTRVRILSGRTKNSGQLVIDFFGLDQFDGLLRRMQFERH